MSKRSLVDLDAAEAVELARTPGDWMQGHHVEQPRCIVAASDPNMSLLGLDNDAMAIFFEEKDAAFTVMASKTMGPICAALREQDTVVATLADALRKAYVDLTAGNTSRALEQIARALSLVPAKS